MIQEKPVSQTFGRLLPLLLGFSYTRALFEFFDFLAAYLSIDAPLGYH